MLTDGGIHDLNADPSNLSNPCHGCRFVWGCDSPTCTCTPPTCTHNLSWVGKPVTIPKRDKEVYHLLKELTNICCNVDSLPAWLMKKPSSPGGGIANITSAHCHPPKHFPLHIDVIFSQVEVLLLLKIQHCTW